MRTNRGFTLIELLVVVAIIGVLMSLLMVVISMVREQARTVNCMSNMRQLGIVFSCFAADNKGSIPGSESDTTPSRQPSYSGDPATVAAMNGWWQGYLWPYVCQATGMPDTDVSSGIAKNSAGARVFMCPKAIASKKVIQDTVQKSGGSLTGGLRVWVSTSYALNGNLERIHLKNGGSGDFGNPAYRPFATNHSYKVGVTHAAELPLLAEIVGVGVNGQARGVVQPLVPCQINGDFYRPSRPFNSYGNDDYNAYAIRANHGKDRSSILFFDLHVSCIQPNTICKSGVCSGSGNGSANEGAPHLWFGLFE